MKLLFMILVCACLLMFAEKPLKKHSMLFYCTAVVIVAAGYLIQTKIQPGLARTVISDYLTSGILPAALFVLVMYAAVLPKKSRIFRCTMSMRGEIAILASILALTHIVYYGQSYWRKAAAGRKLAISDRAALVIAVLLVLLLVPLAVTSFKKIRRKMDAKRWKKLQKWSYLFYALLYLHMVSMAYPQAISGNWNRLADLGCYTAIFGIYTALRVERYLERKKRQAYCPAVWSLLAVLLIAGGFFITCSTAKEIQAEADGALLEAQETLEADGALLEAQETLEADDALLEAQETLEADDALLEAQAASEANTAQEGQAQTGYKDGTWEGEGMGLNGSIRLAVVIEEGQITNIKILERVDDDPYFTEAREGLTSSILKKQSADVDAVSGATFSSQGILEAVKEALELASE